MSTMTKRTQELEVGDIVIGFTNNAMTIMDITWAGGDNYRVTYSTKKRSGSGSQIVTAIERVNSIFQMKESN